MGYPLDFSPHLCVGFLFLILYPGLLLRLLLLRPPPHFVHTHFINKHFVQNTLSTHTLSPHTLSTHALSTYTLCPHTLSPHTLSTNTLSTNTLSTNTLSTHALSTYTLSPQHTHTTHTHTHTHTNRHNTQQHTHNTHTHTHTNRHNTQQHTHNNTTTQQHTHTRAKDTWWHSHTHTHKNTLGVIRGRRGTWWHPPLFYVAGVAQNSHPPSFCVAGVALMVLGGALGPGFGAGAPRHFAWQAWHNLTSTFVSRGRRGTNSHLPSFCVAGVALMVLGGALGPGFGAGAPRHFAWQAWDNLTSTFVSRGRRGTTWHPPSFHVAGVALMVLGGALGPGFGAGAPRHFGWQAWHNLTSTFVSRGRRGTISHLPSFCVSGVALMVLGGALGPGFGAGAPRHFAWQAWHNLTSTFVSRGRRGTNSHLPSFCVAGVALMVLGGALGPGFGAGAPRRTLDGRRGTTSHPPSFHVAGVAQSRIYRRFAWQAWHLWYWVAPLGRDLVPGRRATLRGRRGTTWHPPSFHVAGVAQSRIYRRFAWQAWHLWYWVAPLGRDLAPGRRATLRGRRGTTWHPPSFHVAGVAQSHIYRRFAWQAWHLWYWVAPLGRDLAPGRRATLRGRRGTTWHPPSFHVAGVAQSHIYRRFAWQAWHLWYWVAPLGRDLAPGRRATLRGRRGTTWHPPSFHVAGMAQSHIYRRFAWQAWHLWYCTYIYTYIHTCMHAYIHTYIHTTYRFTFSIFHHLLCLSFLPSPR